MLKIMRGRFVKKTIFWALVVLILPAFVLWGSGSIGRGGGPSYAGKIDNKKVSFEDFYKAVVGVRAQIILNYFDDQNTLETFLKDRSVIGRGAWDRLIMEREARKRNIEVSNAEVITYITETNPIFNRGGAFDEQVYEYVLRNNMGLEPRTFEEIVRQNIALKRLNDMVSEGVTVTDREAMECYKRDNQRFRIAYISFAGSDFAGKVEVPEEEIKDYYDKHRSELIVPVRDPGSDKETMRAASFDDARGDIGAFLAEARGKELALAYAREQRGKIAALTETGMTFADAAAQLGVAAPVETGHFSKTDYLDGIGEAEPLAAAAAGLEPGGLSEAVATRKGAVVFILVDTLDFDEKKFAEAKAEYREKALNEKKMRFLSAWLAGLRGRTTVNIDLDNYQQYYR